jgi:hypothetical protein
MRRSIEQPEFARPSTATWRGEKRPIAAGFRKEAMCDADLKAPIVQKDGHSSRGSRHDAHRPQRADRLHGQISATRLSHTAQRFAHGSPIQKT